MDGYTVAMLMTFAFGFGYIGGAFDNRPPGAGHPQKVREEL